MYYLHSLQLLLLIAAQLKRKEKSTPFGVNLTRSQVLYRAAQELCNCINDDQCQVQRHQRWSATRNITGEQSNSRPAQQCKAQHTKQATSTQHSYVHMI